MLCQHVDGLDDLLAQSIGRFDEMKQLRCVHVQQHTSDLACLLCNRLCHA